MSARRVKVATVIACLVLALAPPFGFTGYLERHAVEGARNALGDYSARTLANMDRAVGSAAAAVAALRAGGAVRCDGAAVDAIQRMIYEVHALREVLVTAGDGTFLCGSAISGRFNSTIDARDIGNDIEIAVMGGEETRRRYLSVRARAGNGRQVAARLAPDSLALDILPDAWRWTGEVRLSLDGGPAFEILPRLADGRDTIDSLPGDVIRVAAVSSDYPLMVEMAVPKVYVMAAYEQIKAYALIVMSVFSAVVLTMAAVIASRRPSPTDDIREGRRRGEFIPFYQPVIGLADGRLHGCEVLMRRRRADGTIDAPAAFIAHAEADGQIMPLTRSLMEKVVADMGDIFRDNPDLTVAFNLCARHFSDDGFVGEVEQIFRGGPIRMEQLVFEITERFPLADMGKAKSIISALQKLGARVALDDAGTGHSGLAAMHRLGMDIVKIDKIFIDSILPDSTHAPIVDSLTDLAQTYGMTVIAEGVETLPQVRYLRARGVHFAQGYLFSPPLPAASFVLLAQAMAAGAAKAGASRKAA